MCQRGKKTFWFLTWLPPSTALPEECDKTKGVTLVVITPKMSPNHLLLSGNFCRKCHYFEERKIHLEARPQSGYAIGYQVQNSACRERRNTCLNKRSRDIYLPFSVVEIGVWVGPPFSYHTYQTILEFSRVSLMLPFVLQDDGPFSGRVEQAILASLNCYLLHRTSQHF